MQHKRFKTPEVSKEIRTAIAHLQKFCEAVDKLPPTQKIGPEYLFVPTDAELLLSAFTRASKVVSRYMTKAEKISEA